MSKRIRRLPIKDGELRLGWAKEPGFEPDVCVSWGDGCSKRDGNLLINALCSERNVYMQTKQLNSVVTELIERGYDIETLRFSIKKKDTCN